MGTENLFQKFELFEFQSRDSAAPFFTNFFFFNFILSAVVEGQLVYFIFHIGQPYLYTRAKTKRLKKPHEGGERSRYIVRGRDVLELGNYNTWKLRDGSLVNKQNCKYFFLSRSTKKYNTEIQ